MKPVLFASVLSLLATTANASMLDCSGFEIIDASGANIEYEVKVERAAFDQRGTPVSVSISRRVNSNTAEPAVSEPILTAVLGQLTFAEAGSIVVYFKDGAISVRPGNSGFTGTRKAFDGQLILAGRKPVSISCPQN